MSKEFYDWLETRPDRYAEPYGNEIWDAAIQKMQAKLDAENKELAALRGFAVSVLEYTISERTRLDAVMFGLTDNEWKPTKLLTGSD